MARPGVLRRWLPVILWAACISGFSTGVFTGQRTASILLPMLATLFPHARPEHLLAIHQAIRKLAHFSEYLVLSVLLYRALHQGTGWRLRAAGLAIVISALYAVLDEFHQWFVPGRTPAAGDCLVDIVGAVAAQGILAARARTAPA